MLSKKIIITIYLFDSTYREKFNIVLTELLRINHKKSSLIDKFFMNKNEIYGSMFTNIISIGNALFNIPNNS